jgi:putative nucleotidyltransferase with HDIG domain
MSDLLKAQELIVNYIKNPSLKKHCYAVETCMKYYATKLGENVEKWQIAGLLHDIDWEKFPETHPITSEPILREAGFDDEIIHAVLSHGYPNYSDTPRESLMDKYLFACDELSGFIVAYSLMKPGRLNDIEGKSVLKKLKDKAFARNISRDDINQGAIEIGRELEEHANNIIQAMKTDKRLALR